MTFIHLNTQNRLHSLAAKLHSKLTLELNGALEKFDLTGPQWQILAAVIYEKCDSPGAISGSLGIDGAAVTRHLDTLERKGLVTRIRSASDRRSVRIEASPAGHEIAPKAFAAAAEVEARLLERLEPGQAELLVGILGDLLTEKTISQTTIEDWERS